MVTDYDSTSLSGHIDVKEDGLLFLSIPYAEGWSAEVDGETAEITPIQDALMGIKLTKGSHDIKLKYTPAGFKEGLLVSSVSVVLIAALTIIPAIVRKKKAGNTAVASVEEVFVSDVITENDNTGEAPAEQQETSEDAASGEEVDPEVQDE
jgi:hypothetical protein